MKKIIIGLFCLLFFDNIFADSYFDVIATDISQEYLKILFGKIESVFPLAKKGLLGEIFGVFNSIALSIGGYILLYIIVVSTINTAATGEVMGKSWSSIWIPLRAVLGIALLVPKSSGYCTIQGIIMWVVVQGIGVANHLWDSTVDTVSKKGPLVNPLDNNSTVLSLFKPENQVRYLVMQTSASAYLTNNVIMTRIEEELNKKRQNAIKNLQDDLQIVQDNRIKYEAAKAKILAEGGSVLDNVIIDENGVMIIEPEEGAEQRILDAMNNYPMVPSFRDTVNFNNTTIEMPGNFGDTEVDKAYNDLYGGISYYKISDFIKVNKQSAYEVKKLAHSTLFMSTSLLAEQIVDGATWNAIGEKYFSDIEIAWGILIDGLDLFDPIFLSTFYISAKKMVGLALVNIFMI